MWLLQAPRKFLTRTSVTVQRAFSQAIRCFSLYQSRLVLGVLIALIYGGTYSNLPYTFQGLQERLSLLFIVSAILPLLTLGALPIFANNDKVTMCMCGLGKNQFPLVCPLHEPPLSWLSTAGLLLLSVCKTKGLAL